MGKYAYLQGGYVKNFLGSAKKDLALLFISFRIENMVLMMIQKIYNLWDNDIRDTWSLNA